MKVAAFFLARFFEVFDQSRLDLFDKGGKHNFTTIIHFQVGFEPYELRQSSARSRRIGQWLPCRVIYMHYEGTMQEKALDLMRRKLQASMALEGKFTGGGFVGEDDGDSIEMALARTLAGQFDTRAA